MRNPECGTLYDCHGGVVTKDTHEYMNKSHLNKYYARHTNWSPDDIVAKTHRVLGIQGPIVPSSSIHGRADTSPSHLNTDSGESGKSAAEDKAWYEKLGGWAKHTFTTWDGWKNRVLPALGFGVCVVASAGICVGAGVAVASTVLIGDRVTTGKWQWGAWVKSMAWGVFGGFSAVKFARWGGAGKFESIWGNAIERTSLRVRPATRTSGAIWKPGPVNWRATRSNMVVNSGFNFGYCGAGGLSVGAEFGSC